jgi:RNA polymerase sigma factor (sigma-70 family)
METRSDDELLESGEPEAFGLFYRRHSRAVLAYVRLRVPDTETAADLTAEVFAAALSARHRYRRRCEPARAWLFGIANNVLKRARRKQFREHTARARLGIPPLDATNEELQRVEELIDIERYRHDLVALVADLPATQREAVLRRVVMEEDFGEIARQQQTTEPVIRQRVSRGLARLAVAARKDPR